MQDAPEGATEGVLERTTQGATEEQHGRRRVITRLDTAPWCSGLTCRPVTAEIVGSNPIGVAICGSSSVVEHRLAKAGVASSNLVFRSIHRGIAQLVE